MFKCVNVFLRLIYYYLHVFRLIIIRNSERFSG